MRPADLVAITGTNAAERRADAFAAGRLIEQLVLRNMPRKDNVRPIAEPQIAADFEYLARPANRFPSECVGGLMTTPGRDDIHDAGSQDSAGNMVQLIRLVADDDRMPGVRPALIADDDLKPRSQQIDELSLGFVSPLQTNDASS